MLSLGELPGEQITKWHKELGHIFKLKMGKQTWVMIDDPLLAHKIFVGHGAQTSNRPVSIYNHYHYSKGGKGIVFSQPGPVFKSNRAVVLSVLAPKQMESFMKSIEKESLNLAKRLIDATQEKGSVDPKTDLELSSMNVIFYAIFGRSFNSTEDPEFQKLSEITGRSIKYAALDEDLPSFLPIFSIFHFLSGKSKIWHDFILEVRDPAYTKLIEEAYTKEGPNVVKSLDKYQMDLNEKIVIMSDLVAAGSDTVAITLSWILAILCDYPEVQKSAIDEIDMFVKKHNRVPTFADRLEVPLCISIMKECMRFKPTTAFGLPHSASSDILVDGYFIPKDTVIISSMQAMHYNAERYPEPDVFNPKRFLNNLRTMNASVNGNFEDRDHFNFGWGRRICPGIYLAEAEIFFAVIQLLARANIEPADEGLPVLEGAVNAGLSLRPVPYKVKFVRRTDALVQ
ncbi:cytochrome P450 [Choanephora cucurbitarum]|nr:cytochrome P450 [Choanephora cucurbitarum]